MAAEKLVLSPDAPLELPAVCACCLDPAWCHFVLRPFAPEGRRPAPLHLPLCKVCARHVRVARLAMVPATLAALLVGPLGCVGGALLSDWAGMEPDFMLLLASFAIVGGGAWVGVYGLLTGLLARPRVDCSSRTIPASAVLREGQLELTCSSRFFARKVSELNQRAPEPAPPGAELPRWRRTRAPGFGRRTIALGVVLALAVPLLGGLAWSWRQGDAEAAERLRLVEARLGQVTSELEKGWIAGAASSCAVGRRELDEAQRELEVGPVQRLNPLARARFERVRDWQEALASVAASRREALAAVLAALPAGPGGDLALARATLARAGPAFGPSDPALQAARQLLGALERQDAAAVLEATDALQHMTGAATPPLVAAARLEVLRPLLAGGAPPDGPSSPAVQPLLERLASCQAWIARGEAGLARGALEQLAAWLPPGAVELEPLRRGVEQVEARARIDERRAALARTIAAEARELIADAPARAGFAPPLPGKALVVGLGGELSPVQARLEEGLGAGPDDAAFTAFLVRAVREEPVPYRVTRSATEELIGPLPGKPPPRTLTGTLLRAEVAVVGWPERELLGVAEVACPPPARLPMLGDRDPPAELLRGNLELELELWIEALPRR